MLAVANSVKLQPSQTAARMTEVQWVLLFSKTAMKSTFDLAQNIGRSVQGRPFAQILPRFSLDLHALSVTMKMVLRQMAWLQLEILLAKVTLLFVVAPQELELMKTDHSRPLI